MIKKAYYSLIKILCLIEALCRILISKSYKNKFSPYFVQFKKENSPYKYDSLIGFRYRPKSAFMTCISYLKKTNKIKYICNNIHKIDASGRPLVIPNIKSKSKKIKRIAILGGSSVAGSGCKTNEESLPSQLQKTLGSNYKVENYGRGGATCWEEFVYYWSAPQDHNVIIHHTGWNTFAYSCIFSGLLKNEPFSYFTSETNLAQQKFISGCKSFGPFLFSENDLKRALCNSLFLKLLTFKSKTKQQIKKKIYSVSNKMWLTPKEASIAAALPLAWSMNFAKINNKQLFIFIQPLLPCKKYKTPKEKMLSKKTVREWLFLRRNSHYLLQEYLKSLKVLFKKYNITFVDLNLKLQYSKEELFNDECHLNLTGNALVAQEIKKCICL